MGGRTHDEQVTIPEDLAWVLRERPEAEAIWDGLPAGHRRGHVIAIERAVDTEEGAERVALTVDHLLEKHSS
jgi:uncharacterized protein YdeI (YjbR/CyaY-like superfamily)